MTDHSVRMFGRTTPLVFAVVAVGTLCAPQTVLAQPANDPEVWGYVGGGVGYYRLNDENFLDEDESLKDNRSSWRAFAGAQFGQVFSLQADYIDFGTTDDGNAKMTADGWAVSAIAAIPLTRVFAPYGKVGQLFWDRKRERGLFSTRDDGDDFFFGVGTRFTLSDRVDLRLEYERFALDDTDLDMASAALQYRF